MGWGGGGRGRVRGVGEGGCERRIKSFCENSKKKILGGGGQVRGGGRVGWGGVRVDVNEKLKFL